jgi:hypothetical protein
LTDDLRREVSRLHHRLDESIRTTRWRRDDQERAERAGDYRGQYRQAAFRLSARLSTLASSSRPILLGPWTGEVGFELLYWIPLLTWAVKRRRLPPERLIAVSRGGPRLWYEHLTSSYRDVLDFVPPESFREQASQRLKQTSWTRLDGSILRAVRRDAGGRVDLLHPQLMYRLFTPLWRQGGSIADVRAFTRFPRFARPPAEPWQKELPAEYVAVKFYASGQFADSEENRRFAMQTIRRLAERTDVVLLTAGAQLDEHAELAGGASPRIHRIDHLVTPATNLDVQSRVIASARAFVGSYGGFAYLAPYFGVPAVSFYASRDSFFEHHLELARHVFDPEKGPGFVALHVRDAELLDGVLNRGSRP